MVTSSPDEVAPCGERLIEQSEELVRDASRAFVIERSAEDFHEPRRGRSHRELAGRDRQPALDLRDAEGIRRQVAPLDVVVRREVDQDGVAVGEGHHRPR